MINSLYVQTLMINDLQECEAKKKKKKKKKEKKMVTTVLWSYIFSTKEDMLSCDNSTSSEVSFKHKRKTNNYAKNNYHDGALCLLREYISTLIFSFLYSNFRI